MPTERTALRDQIVAGIRGVDGVFRRLADQVRQWADRFPFPWNRRVRKQVRALVDGMLDRSIGLTIRAAMVSELYTVISQHIGATRLGVFQRAGILPDLIETPKKLAKWLARAGREAQRVVGKVINRGGDLPAVADVLDPVKAPLTFKPNGQVHRDPDGISPHGTSRARTVVRVETTEAHTEATLDVAARDPSVTGVRFVLSPMHPRIDACDPLAGEDRYGLGVGVYPPGKCPKPPMHVNCMCHIEAVR